jgi:hypothetical protein
MGMLNSPNSVIPTGVEGPAVYSITSAGARWPILIFPI